MPKGNISRGTATASVFLLGLLVARCDDGKSRDPAAAPDFTLEDENPDSSTYGEDRSVSGEEGKVLLVLFVSYT